MGEEGSLNLVHDCRFVSSFFLLFFLLSDESCRYVTVPRTDEEKERENSEPREERPQSVSFPSSCDRSVCIRRHSCLDEIWSRSLGERAEDRQVARVDRVSLRRERFQRSDDEFYTVELHVIIDCVGVRIRRDDRQEPEKKYLLESREESCFRCLSAAAVVCLPLRIQSFLCPRPMHLERRSRIESSTRATLIIMVVSSRRERERNCRRGSEGSL